VSVHKAYIIDATSNAPVEVELHDDLKAEALLDVEVQWTPIRQDLRAKLTTLGVARSNWPESLHWDWGRKGLGLALGAPDDYRVMAIRRQAIWEGAIVTRCKNHIASAGPDVGSPLVYVDYLETAPWNWKVDKIQLRKFKAVGPVLLRTAIEQSYAKGWAGRIGLHALPQAVQFYTGQGLQFVRNDPTKQNLPYYELSAAEAEQRTGRR
jgi:hypothetical protein